MPGMPEITQTAVLDADAEQGFWPLIVFPHGFGENVASPAFCVPIWQVTAMWARS
jgi:hypothetical protein